MMVPLPTVRSVAPAAMALALALLLPLLSCSSDGGGASGWMAHVQAWTVPHHSYHSRRVITNHHCTTTTTTFNAAAVVASTTVATSAKCTIARVLFRPPPPHHQQQQQQPARPKTVATRLYAAAGIMAEEPLPPLPDNYQEEGNARIYQAAALCGVSKDQLAMEWKADKVVVRVHGDNVYVVAETAVAVGDEPVQVEEEDDERLVFSEAAFIDENDSNSFDNDDDDDDELLNYSLDDDGDDDEEIFEDNDDEDEGLNVRQDVVPSDNSSNSISGGGGVDLALLARAINAAFDDKDGEEDSNGGGTGYAIASRYEIEVTTPGTGDEFTTPVMFQAYKGFDVLVQHRDPKSGSIKTIEGRLVEKNSEFVVLNIKGGTKKLKNQNVLCVKLPKAKKEKGVR